MPNRASLKGKDLISIHNLSTDELRAIIDTARELKSWQKAGIPHPVLNGKSLAMIFHKPSLRTRVSFEVAMTQLGGHAVHLTDAEIGFGKRESIGDIAKVLSRMVDGIMIRTFDHNAVLDLARYASVPVINGLDDYLHPTQAIADIITIEEKLGSLEGVRLTYVGDGNNIAHSLMYAAAKTGIHLTVACPEGYDPAPEVLANALNDARESGKSAEIKIVRKPQEAVAGADVVYTDVWASMGQEAERDARFPIFSPYQVNSKLMAEAKPGAYIMHDLPAHRGEEITDEVMDSPASIVFDQAENRLTAQKGILACLI